MLEKKKYVYEGPVYAFDDIIARRWIATTFAVSQAKAESNLLFQFRRSFGYSDSAKIRLGVSPVEEGGV